MTATVSFYSADEIRSRLGISTNVLRGWIPLGREALKLIAEAGIVTLEILDEREQYHEEDPPTMKTIVAACREFSLFVTSFHSRSINYHELGLEPEIERSKRMIDALLEIGGKVWGTHVRIEHPETRSGYEELAKYYEGQDLKLVVENGRSATLGLVDQPIQACIDWVDAVGHPQIGMLFDVGHELNAAGQRSMTLPGEPIKILRNIGHRLHHIHLHDFVEGKEHLPPFTGEMLWLETFKGLKEIGYQGAFMFEPSPSPEFADTIRKVGGVPEMLARLNG